MIDNQVVRFGLIGAGQIAGAYAQAFSHCHLAKLVAVADVRADAARAMADLHHCRSFGSWKAMLQEMKLDAVVICTPPVTHPDICISVARTGTHVLCEKPLAMSSESARAMVQVAQESGIKFTMASKFRYVDDVIQAKSLVASGVIGDVVLFENTFAGRVDMRHRWNADPGISGGGVLIDNGTHSVDILRYFLGPLSDVEAVEGIRVQELPVEDTVHVFARTEAGVMCNIDLSWSLNKESPYFISIYGSTGTILVGWKESKYRRSADEDWTIFGKGYDKIQAFTNQLTNFAAAIAGGEELLIQPQDAIASVEVVEVAYQALGRDGWVKVSPAIEQEFSKGSV